MHKVRVDLLNALAICLYLIRIGIYVHFNIARMSLHVSPILKITCRYSEARQAVLEAVMRRDREANGAVEEAAGLPGETDSRERAVQHDRRPVTDARRWYITPRVPLDVSWA